MNHGISWVTEEECVPVLENIRIEIQLGLLQAIHLKELIPGIKNIPLRKYWKLLRVPPRNWTKVNELYKSVITAGTHLAPSIKVARSCQSDWKFAARYQHSFVNELAKIFNLMNIDTHAVWLRLEPNGIFCLSSQG
jgi:UDP-N-acetyl-D-galactosamine dehydrogenase